MNAFLYKYKIQLEVPTIIATNSGDPNSCSTLDYIPGNTLRGALAGNIMRKNQPSADKDKYINQLVLNENVRFLPAYIEVEEQWSGYPIPLFLKQQKHSTTDTYTNMFSFDSLDEITESYKSVTGYINLGVSLAKLQTVKRSTRMHHRRDRALGCAHKKNGDLFAYEYIDEGQNFCGYIKIVAQNEELAFQTISDIKSNIGEKIYIGRSRKAGYGGNATIFIESKFEKREFSGTDYMPTLTGDIEQGASFIVYLTTPYIGRDRITGLCRPDFIIEDLTKAFDNQVELESLFTATELVGGYNRKWQSEIPQAYAMKAGSTLKFKALQTISRATWLQIESNGIGIRKNEGFGNIAFISPVKARDVSLNKAKRVTCLEPKGEIPETLKKLEKTLLLAQAHKLVDIRVAELIADTDGNSYPPNSLIGRFRNLFYNPKQAIKTINEWLGDVERLKLKRPARKHLERCFLAVNGEDLSLNHLLKKVLNEGKSILFIDSFFRQLQQYVIYSKKIEYSYFDENTYKELSIAFLSKLFNAMALKNRSKEQ